MSIMGVGVHPLTLAETVEEIAARIGTPPGDGNPGEVYQVITLNPEMLYRASGDQALRELLNGGDLVAPDGYGILWAGERLGCHLPERVTGIDLVRSLAARAEAAGWRLYLLGGAPGVAGAAAGNLQRQHPGLQVVGTGHGYFTADGLPAVLDQIRAGKPDLLLVGMGFPRQERLISGCRRQLGRLVAVGVGGSFDVISGRLRRSPSWVQRLRLEWLFRALQEPARWRRLMVLPRFVVLVLSARREWDSRRADRAD